MDYASSPEAVRKHAAGPKPGVMARFAEAGLWLVFVMCAGWYATGVVQGRAAQRSAEEVEVSPRAPQSTSHPGQLLGRLEIVPVGLSVPVLENYDAATLRRGVGHVPGTAVPGGLGNLVLAGHRDTFFRPLRHVTPGMEIRLVVPGGHWRYRIDRTEVVTPDQVRVLAIGDVPEMTLITCYPFEFIGSAPQRFIVHAHLVSADAT